MKPHYVDLDLDSVARVKNALDPIDPQDYVTKSFGDANYSGVSSGYQKYYVAPLENYSIPIGFSSVITGPFDFQGVLSLEGRLEIL